MDVARGPKAQGGRPTRTSSTAANYFQEEKEIRFYGPIHEGQYVSYLRVEREHEGGSYNKHISGKPGTGEPVKKKIVKKSGLWRVLFFRHIVKE